MSASRSLWIPALISVALAGAAPGVAQKPTTGAAKPGAPRVVRVFRLPGMELTAATQLLRTEVAIRSVASVASRGAIVVADAATQVDRAELLLRQRDAATKASTPHAPLDLQRLRSGPAVERIFRVPASDQSAATILLRSIYGVREIHLRREGDGFLVRSTAPLLDASEALLRDLGMLRAPAATG